MKVLNFSILILVTLSILSACKSTVFKRIEDSIPITDYTAYVFRLCEYRNTYGNKRFFLCDTPCEPRDLSAYDSIQVVEELYAFQSKKNPQDIIYITSKSDKYIQKNAGIFNAESYKRYISVRDFEYVYFGVMTNNRKISFVNPEEALTFWLRKVPENCRFVVDSIYSETAVKNSINEKKLGFADLFNVPIQFLETDRMMVQSRKDTTAITTIRLEDGELYFEGGGKSYSLSQKRRLKYHPIYRDTHDSIVQKIVKDSLKLNRQLQFDFGEN